MVEEFGKRGQGADEGVPHTLEEWEQVKLAQNVPGEKIFKKR